MQCVIQNTGKTHVKNQTENSFILTQQIGPIFMDFSQRDVHTQNIKPAGIYFKETAQANNFKRNIEKI